MSQEILTPFQLTPSGGIALTTDPRVQAEQHVASLVSTNPGERVMLPGYGVSLASLVFAPNNLIVTQTITADVTKALAQWEPSIIVNSVAPASSQDPTTGVAMVSVDFQTGALPGTPGAAPQVATILVGGTVIEDGS